jgi:hypothetical protein
MHPVQETSLLIPAASEPFSHLLRSLAQRRKPSNGPDVLVPD